MITKSNYLHFDQCAKYLWLEKNRKDLLPTELDADAERRFADGALVESEALKLFPEHVDCSGEKFFDGPKRTAALMATSARVLYQPAFLVDDLYARSDVLVRAAGGRWDICEIKSSTQVKEIHTLDLAFQKHVIESAGFKIGRCYVTHINNEYVRQGEIEPGKLLVAEDVTIEVVALESQVRRGVAAARQTLASKEEPAVRILKQCSDPYDCPLIPYCWRDVPNRSIYETRLKADQLNDLLDRDIVRLADVPDEMLVDKRDHWHWEAVRSGQPRVIREGIAEQLKPLEYPVHYLDYEAYASALPPFDGYRPYQYLPFQYSLHVQAKPGGKLKHYEFLADEWGDPATALAAQLSKEIGPKGSVVAWNASFERGCNELVAKRVPKHARFFERVNARLYDPITIVRSGDYYDARFGNSASLKAVLPVIAPEKAYDDLEIHEGGTAMAMWPKLCSPDLPKREKAQLRKDMLAYCARDTEAMVVIVDFFRGLTG
ncbi:MAG: DUF2779 domain-containing protein [Patescibacteria group bacterium]|nr:DUF2779 domain-containing protein [Patescibacteria group bacterium]